MAQRQPINPWAIAPASARKVESTFVSILGNDAWTVSQEITWHDGDCWDGAFHRIASGLTKAEAEALVAELSVTRGMLAASVAAMTAEAA